MRALPVIEISNEEVYVSITFCSRVDLSGSLNQQTNKKKCFVVIVDKNPNHLSYYFRTVEMCSGYRLAAGGT